MAQKSLERFNPHIEGDARYGFRYLSFITTDTAFAASAGLSGTAVAGQLRYDTSTNTFVYWNGSAEATLAASSSLTGVGLDEGYDINPIVTVDSDDVQFAGTTTDDIVSISSSGATASDKALLDLVWTGTPNAGGNMIRLDVSAATVSGVPSLIEVVGAGKTCRGLYIDTDGTTVGAAAFHSGGALTNGVGVVNITNDGNLATGGNLLNITVGGTPNAAAIATEIVASKDCQALVVTSSAATDSAVEIHGAGAIANNKAILEIVDDGEPANAGSNIVRIDASGSTATNKAVMLELVGTGKTVRGLEIDTDIADAPVALINGGGNLADGIAILSLTHDGATQTAGGVVLSVANSGTPDADSRLIELVGASKDMTAMYIDCDSATNHGIYFRDDGNPAAGKAMLYLDLNGDPNATGALLALDATGATATNTAYSMRIDNSTTDMGAIYIDADNVTDHTVHIHCGGALADNKAVLNLSMDGTPASGIANYLRIDASGATSTNVPTAIEVVGAGETMQGLYIDTDGTNKHQNHFHGGGALTNGLGVVGITNDGNLATGGNLLNLTVGGTPDAAAIAFEIASNKDCQAVYIDTDAATDSGVEINGGGAIANNKAVLEVTWDGTPANAGSNLVRIDGSGGTNTAKPVLLEVYDDSVAVGLSVSTASIEDMVTFIGTGATGSAKSVVDITSTATLNAAGNLLRLDLTGATCTSVPTALEIVGTGKTARGIYVDTDGTSVGAAKFHSGGALTDGVGVVNITNDGNLAAGGNLLNVTMGGTPADATVAAVEIVAAKDCLALDISTSAASTHGVQITGIGAINDNKAVLDVAQATGTMANGSSIVRIEGTTAATATAYGLEIACNATNLEGLNVSAGTSVFAETVACTANLTVGTTLGVTGAATLSGGAGITNWTVDAATATSDGTGTGVIPDNVNCVQITSTNTDYWCTLPTPTPGKEVWIIADATSACELRSSAAATVAINNVVGAGCELTITADTTYHALCINATNWIVSQWDNAGAVTGGGTPN